VSSARPYGWRLRQNRAGRIRARLPSAATTWFFAPSLARKSSHEKKEEKCSRTAYRVALRRASHQLLDDPKVFDDPLAWRVLGPKTMAELQSDSGVNNPLSRAPRLSGGT
jgi:hypothetical protein